MEYIEGIKVASVWTEYLMVIIHVGRHCDCRFVSLPAKTVIWYNPIVEWLTPPAMLMNKLSIVIGKSCPSSYAIRTKKNNTSIQPHQMQQHIKPFVKRSQLYSHWRKILFVSVLLRNLWHWRSKMSNLSKSRSYLKFCWLLAECSLIHKKLSIQIRQLQCQPD